MIKEFSIRVNTEKDEGGFDTDEMRMAIEAKEAYGCLYDLTVVGEGEVDLAIDAIASDCTLSLEETESLSKNSELIAMIIKRVVHNRIEYNNVNMELYR